MKSALGSRAVQTVEHSLVKPIRSRPAGKHKTRVTTDQWVLGEGTAGMLAAIVKSSDAAIINKTLDGIVTSWNHSAERIFGYTASEMIGQPIHVIAVPNRPKEMMRNLERIRRGQLVTWLDYILRCGGWSNQEKGDVCSFHWRRDSEPE